MATPITRQLDCPPDARESVPERGVWLANLTPGGFAFVMATGIVAHDAGLAAPRMVESALLWIAVVGYIALLVVTLARLIRFPKHVLADLGSQSHGPGFLALVAATCVIGAEFAPLIPTVSTATWLLGGLLWVGVTYAFFVSVAVQGHKPRPSKSLSGSWLLTVVATQSVSVLGTLVGSQFSHGEWLVLFISLSLFLSGCTLYLVLIPLILHRLEFLSLAPLDFTPDYWINMGAMAITSLAGTMLIGATDRWPLLAQLAPFLIGLSMLFWAGATWWIPLLFLLEGWRHVLRHVRLVYGTEYWSVVFPVGMFAACTFDMATLVHLALLTTLAQWLTYVALGLWLVVFAGLAQHIPGGVGLAVRGVTCELSQGRGRRSV